MARDDLQHRLLYTFQHIVLPEAAFQNHPELIRALASKNGRMPLLHFQSKASLHCVRAGFLDASEQDSDAQIAAEIELYKPLALHSHNLDGYTAHVVAMPEPERSLECYFAAIYHRDDEPKEYMKESVSTRYFTLERSQEDGPVFCEHQRNGTHVNYGKRSARDLDSFVNAVFSIPKSRGPA